MAPATVVEDESQTLETIIDEFVQASSIPAKQRTTKISSTIQKLVDRIYANGISAELLTIILNTIINPNHIDQPNTTLVIRNLYPTTLLSSSTLLQIISALGLGAQKPSFPTQTHLLRWLIMIYDLVDHKTLGRCYTFLFGLLDIGAIRAPLCHLLSLITRRKHVRPWRIQGLMELMRKCGEEGGIGGLLGVYRDYYPDVVVLEMRLGRGAIFKHPNPEFAKRLGEVREINARRGADGEESKEAFMVSRKMVRNGRSSVIPEVHTSHAQPSSITLEEVSSLDQFVSKLETIEFPNQLVSALTDPLLQRLIQLRNSETVQLRIERWLEAFFFGFSTESVVSSELIEMFGAITQYAEVTRVLPNACLEFMQTFLPEWDGMTGREEVLQLLTYLPLLPYHDLQTRYFQPLEDALLDSTPTTLETLLHFYTHLLQNIHLHLLTTPIPPHTPTTLTALQTHASNLSLTLLSSPHTPTTPSSILTYLSTYTSLLTHPTLHAHIRITIPPPSLIYLLTFTSSLTTLSRLCAILARYKRAFEAALLPSTTTTTTTPAEPYAKEYVNILNGFLMDICNCLWRSRAFNTLDINALGCLFPPTLTTTLSTYITDLSPSLRLESLFSLSYSPTLCLLTTQYMQTLENEAVAKGQVLAKRHTGPVTQFSLRMLARERGVVISWADWRVGVLRFLEGKGVSGVGELMSNTMKNLMQNRGGEHGGR